MAKQELLPGLHYALDQDGVTITLFKGPKSPNGTRPRWADAEEIVKEIRFDVNDVPAVLQDDGEGENAGPKSLAAFGLLNLLTDRTSQVAGDPEAKLGAMEEYMEVFKRGIWRERKASGGRAAKVDAAFALAVTRNKGLKDSQVSAVAAALRRESRDTLKQIRALPAIQKELEKIRKESEEEVELDFDLPAASE